MNTLVYLIGLFELAGFTVALWWFGGIYTEQTVERKHLDEEWLTLTRRNHRLIRDRIDLDRGWTQLAKAEAVRRAETETETIARFGMPPIANPDTRPTMLHLVNNPHPPSHGDEPA